MIFGDALYTVGGIDHVLVRHEQAVSSGSPGARDREAGVKAGNVGSRATNAITDIATAYMDSTPLVLRSDPADRLAMPFRSDMVGISGTAVKHSFGYKRKTFAAKRLSAGGAVRPGPVVVDYRKIFLNPANKYPRLAGMSVCVLQSHYQWTQG